MFRPMAVTMACALFGALVYSVVFFPALLVTFVPPPKSARPALGHRARARVRSAPRAARCALKWVLLGASRRRARRRASSCSRGAGADFVPRIDEGDLVVTIRRAPSISLARGEGARSRGRARARRASPRSSRRSAMTGRAEVAIDPVGNDNTDIFVHLRPKKEWTTAHDLDDLSVAIKNAIESEVPGTFVSVSQPIEDKTNELISGSRADVQIAIFGDDLDELKRLSEEVGAVVRGVRGTGDVRVERVLGAPHDHRAARSRAPRALRRRRRGRARGGRGRARRHARRLDLRGPAPLRSAPARAAAHAARRRRSASSSSRRPAGGTRAALRGRDASRRPRARRRSAARPSRAPCASR